MAKRKIAGASTLSARRKHFALHGMFGNDVNKNVTMDMAAPTAMAKR